MSTICIYIYLFIVCKKSQVSTACMSICIWVMALQHYNDVQRMVEPKQRRVKEAREALQIAEKNLTEKQV